MMGKCPLLPNDVPDIIPPASSLIVFAVSIGHGRSIQCRTITTKTLWTLFNGCSASTLRPDPQPLTVQTKSVDFSRHDNLLQLQGRIVSWGRIMLEATPPTVDGVPSPSKVLTPWYALSAQFSCYYLICMCARVYVRCMCIYMWKH